MIQTPTQSNNPSSTSRVRTSLIALIIVFATIPVLVTLWWMHYTNNVHHTRHKPSNAHAAPTRNPWAVLWNRTTPTALPPILTPTPTMTGWGTIVSAQANPYTTSLFPTIEMPPPLLLEPTPTPTFLPLPSPDLQVVGYNVHLVEPGEDVFHIAANGGSDAPLLGQYNKLTGPPQEGCPLIVPQIAGQWSMLPQIPHIVRHGCTQKPWVAITLDDCPDTFGHTERILDALRERDVHITFFVLGIHILANPEAMRQIVADGHEIANHSYTHANFVDLTEGQMIAELADTEQLVFEMTGASTRPYFRPTFGFYDNRVLSTVIGQGYLPVFWTLDGRDAYGSPKTADYMLNQMTNVLPPERLRGAIILAHCTQKATAKAFPAILDRFAEMGYEVRPLSDVLQ